MGTWWNHLSSRGCSSFPPACPNLKRSCLVFVPGWVEAKEETLPGPDLRDTPELQCMETHIYGSSYQCQHGLCDSFRCYGGQSPCHTQGDSSCSLQRHRQGQEIGRRAPLCCHCLAGHGVRDRARGCSLPVQDRVEDNVKALNGAARADSDPPPCSSGMQEGSVGAVFCPFLAMKYWHPSAVTMPTLIQCCPNFTLVSCCTLPPLEPLH